MLINNDFVYLTIRTNKKLSKRLGVWRHTMYFDKNVLVKIGIEFVFNKVILN